MSEEEGQAQREPEPSFLGPRVFAGAILAFGLFVLYGVFRISGGGGYSAVGPRFFPLVVAVGLLVFGAVLLLRTTALPDRDLGRKAAEERAATHWPTPALVATALVVYAFVLDPLGYVVATTLFFAAAAFILGNDRVPRALAIGVVLAVVVYFGFTEFLGVRLPGGLLDLVL